MADRSPDWFSQARHDLEVADGLRRSSNHEWACFAAHQAAEKAVKALHLHLGQEAWGHVVARLLGELPQQVRISDDLVGKAQVLDAYYVPTRYPNGHPEGAPFEHYGSRQSEEAVRLAREVVEFVGLQMA